MWKAIESGDPYVIQGAGMMISRLDLDRETFGANVRLAAAAPDLLAALEALAYDLRFGISGRRLSGDLGAAVNMVEAAIAKAKGE